MVGREAEGSWFYGFGVAGYIAIAMKAIINTVIASLLFMRNRAYSSRIASAGWARAARYAG